MLFVSGCNVVLDKGAGVVYTNGFLGDMSHGYTDHSGLVVVNPSQKFQSDLRMEVTYSICIQLNRSSELWGASQRRDSYPIAEVYRGKLSGMVGGDIFIPATKLTNHRNILRVTVEFYSGDKRVGYPVQTERRAYFYQGTWYSEWYPYPQV
ncbi:MAG: hypothetical protein COV01_00750 [Candidatus Taylorbacteria bacterium CG10_big_fil_rev_8_21_14_0_10_41_48]|uniref:Uncharacterized protein n=1 Tax=Candidatus Taylorbacteria bacterium CG10_big_fil_rev_8_21_14_0_10_41_48 TaxID=1975024 RepID=A0A2M8LD41_9BACT|nr:MAG: hypothetical protein COV01_00750 [Candidatus Taylorbacteria bacterium CG10_big_fil_rev_8_21_14_0_10_41_48]